MTSVDLHLAHAATDLAGNGASPVALLDQRRSAIFTAPDLTQSRLAQVSASATHRWSEDTSLAGTIYSRRVRVASFNGDANEYEPCDDVPDMLCDDSGNPLRTMGGAATSNFNAIANLGTRWQRGTGASMAFRTVASLGGIEHQWLAGAEARRGALTYQSLQRLGTLDSRRYVDDTGPTVDAASVAVAARTKDWSFYLDDAMRLGEAWTLNLALRFNHSAVGISDRSGQNPALDGQHAFRRPEPSLGLAWAFTERASTYVSYAESTRVPTPMELTCANPDAPCRLPNDFISDPPLKQVVARSVEWGVRGSHGSSPWTVAAFRTTSAQDIAFQSTGGATSNRGFFANVGDTRRDGLEATLQRQLGAVRWRGSYTLLRAVYLSGFAEADENHPRAQDGVIHVQKGDQLPGLPRHNLKLDMDWSVANGFSLGLDGRYVSGQRLRGDESNQLPPISGYVLFDASTTWHPSPRWIWTLRIENLLDRKYASFGTLGEPSEVFPNSTTHASLALERPAPPTWRWSSSYSRRLGAARVALAE
jgi:outer membrane receptor protein involved in Fe transport